MAHDDIFLSRLNLMIIAAKAFIEDYPIDGCRKNAIARNAHEVIQILAMGTCFKTGSNCIHQSMDRINTDYLLNERVNLLAIMSRSLAEENPIGRYRKRVIQSTVDFICRQMELDRLTNDIEFLKVA